MKRKIKEKLRESNWALEKQMENNRKLTKAEEKRKASFEVKKAELEAEGWHMEDLTVGLIYANVMALALCLPVIAVLALIYGLRALLSPGAFIIWHAGDILRFALLFVLLVFVHEFIHGLFWAIFAKSHWKSVSFGFIAEYMTPYCSCSEPLGKAAYTVGAVMPCVLLGVLPALAGIFTGSLLSFLTGCSMILAAGGDLTILLKLLRHRTDDRQQAIYMDHPYQAGLVAFVREGE